MKVLTNFVPGPFKNEAEFKRAFIKLSRELFGRWVTIFEIENEEKEPGMPDILSVSRTDPAVFTELKYVGEDGKVKFQPSQPAFYKRHENLLIQILAWDSRHNRCVVLFPKDITDARTLYVKLPDGIKETVVFSER